jgi:phosphoribosylformylglycinamidine synthase
VAQTWSEHCKHKEFNALIHFVDRENRPRRNDRFVFKTYIRASTEDVARRWQRPATIGW